MSGLFNFLFGCYHKNFSFPITKKRGQRLSPAASLTGTYVVCLDCGKEFPYDWQEMKIIHARSKRLPQVAAEARQSFASK
jgi:hypothetical protein